MISYCLFAIETIALVLACRTSRAALADREAGR